MPALNDWMIPACLLSIATVSVSVSQCDDGGGDGKPSTLDHDILFTEDNPFLEPIPADAEVDPDSDLYIDKLVSIVQSSTFGMLTNEYGFPVFYAEADTPRYDVLLTYYGTYSYCGLKLLKDVPIPDFAEENSGSDHKLVIIDRDRGCEYDFFGFDQATGLTDPNAWWASGLPIDTDGIYHETVGAGHAANFAGTNGLVWPDEIDNGEIPHALIFTYYYEGVREGDPVPPATHSDGASADPAAIPQGTRLQLNPDLDLDSLDLEFHERVIARALQVYGMFLAESAGSGVYLLAVSGTSTEPNAWIGVIPDGDEPKTVLSGIPVDQLRVLRIPDTVPNLHACEDNPCATYE